ncbi:MAG: hypothetical protein AAF558_16005, partial [Verrucomicrobiota bacterium]
MSEPSKSWSLEDATKTYLIDRWGAGYYQVDSEGRLAGAPMKQDGPAIPLTDIVKEAKTRGIDPPFVIRFQDLLRHRVESINRSFMDAIKERGYQGQYRGVFPIKVNHLREVVEEIMDAGKPYHFGLEVGRVGVMCVSCRYHVGVVSVSCRLPGQNPENLCFKVLGS